MPRVVPSQVVGFINSLWPAPEHHRGLNRNQAGQLSGLIDLIDQIPAELLAMDSAVYAPFIWAKAHIRQRLLMWVSETRFGNELGYMPGQPEQSPVTVIRDALDQCDDESPAPGTSDLQFITDEKLRTNLRNDIGVVHRALANSEWKAATVLAGSAAEALLLWALTQRQQPEITNAITVLIASGGLESKPDSSLDRWNLYSSRWPKTLESLSQIPQSKQGSRKTSEISFTPASLSASAKNVTVPQPFLRSQVWSTLSETSLHKQAYSQTMS